MSDILCLDGVNNIKHTTANIQAVQAECRDARALREFFEKLFFIFSDIEQRAERCKSQEKCYYE